MDVGRAYGRDNEPELQKMAAFLKERCERGRYGLRYYDNEKKMIQIPWPTVPRQSEDVPESFHMFTEWAYLSFRKRGGRGEQLESEAMSAQKHRFRNALARADGLKFIKELSTEGLRVYEFADTKKEKEHSENGNYRYNNNKGVHSPQSNYDNPQHDYQYNTHQLHHPVDMTEISRTTEYQNDWTSYGASPMAVTSSPNHVPCYQHPVTYQIPPDQISQGTEMQDEREPSIGTLIEEMINTPEPTLPDAPVTVGYQQPNGAYNTYAVPQPVRNGSPVAQALPPQDYPMAQAQQVPGRYVSQAALPVSVHVPSHQVDDIVSIKVYFRGDEVMRKSVTNSSGFRLYSGNNVPDMSRLLDTAQRDQLQHLTRFKSEHLFGPDSVEQVEMPLVKRITDKQSHQTDQILSNMDRGLLFYIEHPTNENSPYVHPSIPNVYCIRLCQTRVFPHDTNVEERDALECDGLARMKWAKVFDSNEFLRQTQRWIESSGPVPSSSILLSVGQKPKKQEGHHCLVSIAVSVTKAKFFVDRYVEDQLDEIYISDKNSMDNAAQLIKNQIRQKIQLDDAMILTS